ncbi:DUF1236 domain-containing protein [Pleomorphomonas koreensis]|uniref:DUF1236 domain-containing protein n=1 Tax=Pleomorphomonas koreensis TaxID=257440 RepID=UPI000404566D|nr:DUF1236 domain-containing protein [Pleomorphomonas koreensis]
MNRILAASILAGAAAFASNAFAQEGTVSGAVGGAATGAVVGGPVGAVVGGVAGAAIGTILAPPPPEVRTVVVQQTTPSVVYDQPIVVGQPLPTTVVLYPVPGYDNYYYTVVNNERVIVDPQSRTVLQVVN